MKLNQGITLLEIVIAIALIAIFVTLPILAYGNYLKKTRDTQRKNSINRIQAALEQYKANNSKYPSEDSWQEALTSQLYLPTIPTDPLEGQPVPGEEGITYGFYYSSDGTTYVLSSRLEENPGSYYTVTPEGPKVVYTTPGSVGKPVSHGGLLTNTPQPSTTFIPTTFHTPTPTKTPTSTPTNTVTPTYTPVPTTTFTPSPTPRFCWGINGTCSAACVNQGVTNVVPVTGYSSCSPATYYACWNQGGSACGVGGNNVGEKYTVKYSTPACNGTIFGYFMSATTCEDSTTGHCYRGSNQFQRHTFSSAGTGSDKNIPGNSCSSYGYGPGGSTAYTDTVEPQECTYSAAPGCPVKTYGPSGGSSTRYSWSGSFCNANGAGNCYILNGSPSSYITSGGQGGCNSQQLYPSYTQCQWIQY